MRPAFCVTTVALLVACTGGSGGSSEDVRPSPDDRPLPADAARSLVAAPVFSACGTPVVDGVASPGEWDGAVSVRFGVVVPESLGGGEIPATLQAMSDDVNLYVAVRLERPMPSVDQSHFLELDVDRSGTISAGDDGFGFTRFGDRGWGADWLFTDVYRCDCTLETGPGVCGPADATPYEGCAGGAGDPGTNDGAAAMGFDAESTFVEAWHPYGGSDPHDLHVLPGDEIAMSLFVRLLDACGDEARCLGDTFFPRFQGYRPFVVGCGAPPEEAVVTARIEVKPGDALPTIQLSAGGVVAVAVLGSADFDAATVDPEATWFAGAPVARRAGGTPDASVEDVDADGFADAVLHFETAALRLDPTATEATIAGATSTGRRFSGTDAVRVLP